MSSTELNDLTEGDMLYLQYLSINKEEIIISSDESAFYDDTNCSDNDTSDNIQNGHTIRKIKDIKNEIEIIDNETPNPETISKDADCTPKHVSPTATDVVQITSVSSRASPSCNKKIVNNSSEKIVNSSQQTSISLVNSDITCQSLHENTTDLRQEISQAIIKEKRFSTASETAPENATDSQEESSQTSVKKKRFSSKNLIKLFCTQCDKTIRRVWGEKRTKCNGCKCLLHHQCAKCYRSFRTYQSAFLHVKHECRLLSKHASFNCTRCYFESKSKEKLEEHEVDRHMVLNCQDCGVSCESNQMMKHQLYQCEARMEEESFSADNTSETDINKTNKTSVSSSPLKKPNKYNSHCFLEMYCKRCEKTVTKVKQKSMQKCDDCKKTLLHQCITCCRRYKLVISAYAHVRACNNPHLFHCTQCDYKTSHKACLVSHEQYKHQAQKCDVCGSICENKQALKAHQKQCISNSLYKDDFSRSTKKSTVSSKSRKRKPTRNVLKFFCATCNTVTERSTEQNVNCQTCGSPFQFYCTRCRSTFVSFARGYAHIRRVCSRYRCKQCEFRSARRKQLQEHVALEHQLQPQPQPEPQQQMTLENQLQPQSEPQQYMVLENQLQPQLQPQPEPQQHVTQEDQPQPQPQPELQQHMTLEHQPQLQPQPEAQQHITLEQQPQPQLQPEHQQHVTLEHQPQPEPQQHVTLKDQPQPQTQPEPQQHKTLEHQVQPRPQSEPQQLGKNIKVQCQGCGRMIRGNLLAGHLEECDSMLRCENCDFKGSKVEIRKTAKLLQEKESYDCPKCDKKLLHDRSIGKQLNKDCPSGILLP